MKIIENFLPESVLQDIELDLGYAGGQAVWTINHFKWGPELTKDSPGYVFITKPNPLVKYKVIESILAQCGDFLKKNNDPAHIRMIYHLMDSDSSISWHTDQKYRWACTIYLEDWDADSWGGNLEFRDTDGQINSIQPKRNLAVFNTNCQEHRVSVISKDSEVFRKSLQIFYHDGIPGGAD